MRIDLSANRLVCETTDIRHNASFHWGVKLGIVEFNAGGNPMINKYVSERSTVIGQTVKAINFLNYQTKHNASFHWGVKLGIVEFNAGGNPMINKYVSERSTVIGQTVKAINFLNYQTKHIRHLAIWTSVFYFNYKRTLNSLQMKKPWERGWLQKLIIINFIIVIIINSYF